MELFSAAYSELLQMPWQGALVAIAVLVLATLGLLLACSIILVSCFSSKQSEPEEDACHCSCHRRQGINPLTMAPYRD